MDVGSAPCKLYMHKMCSSYVFAMTLLLSEETALCLGKPACHWSKLSLPSKETAELELEPNLLSYQNEVEQLTCLLPGLRREKAARMSPVRKVMPVSPTECPWKDGKGARGTVSAAVLPLGSFSAGSVGLSLSITACALKELVGCHAQSQG